MYPSHPDVAWAILLAAGLLALLAFVLQPSLFRDVFISRKTLLWVNDAILILAVICIGIILGHIFSRHHYRYDLTSDRLFSISDATVKVLKNLKTEVKITAFYPQNTPEGQILENLLRECRKHTDKLSFSMVDPFRDPMTARAMNVHAGGVVVIQCGDSRKDIFPAEIFPQPHPYMRDENFKPTFQGERMITSAILNVTSGRRRMVQFVSGHGEVGIASFDPQGYAAMKEYLTKENYTVQMSSLVEGIATGANVVAIIAPKKEYLPVEVETLRKFMQERQGNLLIALDPDCEVESVEEFLSQEFGVNANREIIVDPRGVQNNVWTVAPECQDHAIVEPLKEKNLIPVFFYCRGLSFEPRQEWTTQAFLRTIAQAYAKRSEADIKRGRDGLAFNPEFDARGPLNLGLALESRATATGSRVVILGNSAFASNSLFRNGANADLFVNVINWLAGQEEQIAIRPKTIDYPTIILDQEAELRIFLSNVVIPPLLVLMVGGAVWLSRRRV